MKWKCKEALISREPYKKYGACLNTAKKLAKEVFPDPDYVDDIFETESFIHKPTEYSKCDFDNVVPEECVKEGLTHEECIKKYGFFETHEWCLRDEPSYPSYKYGIEVNCDDGLIYIYYCVEEEEK